MAIRASVTVSIAALASGILRVMLREILVLVSTPLGTTSDSAGSRSTSSKVSPSMANLLGTPSALSSLVIAGDMPSVVRSALRLPSWSPAGPVSAGGGGAAHGIWTAVGVRRVPCGVVPHDALPPDPFEGDPEDP